MYEIGGGYGGLKKNHTITVMLYEKSAAQGNPQAQALLGCRYESGDGGLPRDLNKALELYTKSAAQRDPLGVMQFNRLIKTKGRKPHLFTS